MNVMIVDDEVLTRTNVKYILEAEIPAYTGTTSYMLCGEAGSGAEALEKLPVCRPDIVLSDMRMPGMNGLELCETLHKQYPCLLYTSPLAPIRRSHSRTLDSNPHCARQKNCTP